MSARPRRHVARRLLVALALSGAGLGACACSSADTAGALEHKACVDVHRSIALYDKAAGATSEAATRQRARAMLELRSALSPAALASSNDSSLQALTATLSETSRVPESQLITALRAQCASTLSS